MERYSNTSHVTINHLSHYSNSTRQRNSNTSHVTINLEGKGNMKYPAIFKYISCYY